MPTTPQAPPEVFQDLHFPLCGLDVSTAFDRQPNRPTPWGGYARTTPVGLNVRSFEPVTNRARGAQRAGLARYINAQPAAGLVQHPGYIVSSEPNKPGGHMQSSQSGRVVTLVAVSGGVVYVADAGDTAWQVPANHTAFSPPLNAAGVVYSAVNNQKLYFADGANWCYYIPATNSIETWTPTAGTLPVDGSGNKPRLICTWRGRSVLSGLLYDPQNWFMSAVSDPGNFDYEPRSPSPAQAVAGNNSTLGLVGDVITALVPLNDDMLLLAGDHTLWMMRGDPMSGGQIDRISDVIGMAWGVPWCRDPYGTLYFVSNKLGIYSYQPGQGAPQRISQQIEQLLAPLDTGANTITLIWDDRWQGFHVFVTPTAAAGAATHFFYEARVGAWWQDQFANNSYNPLCCTTFDGNTPGDRVALIGSWDGYVRYLNPAATQDDGYAIASSVVIGPLLTKDLDELLLKDLQAVLASGSGPVSYAVYVGATAEIALASPPVSTGTWTAGRNIANHIRRSGYAIYVKLTATSPWAMEAIRARLQGLGKVRRRGR